MHEQDCVDKIINKVATTVKTNKQCRLRLKLAEQSQIDVAQIQALYARRTRGTVCEGMELQIVRPTVASTSIPAETDAFSSQDQAELIIESVKGKAESNQHFQERHYVLEISQRILMPINFSNECRKAFDWVVGRIRQRPATLYLLHVLPDRKDEGLIHSPSVCNSKIDEQMNDWLDAIQRPLTAVPLYGRGSVSTEVSNVFNTEAIDLVVIASNSMKNDLRGLWHTSITQNVIHKVSGSVLVLHPNLLFTHH